MRIYLAVIAVAALSSGAHAQHFACGTNCTTACYEEPPQDPRFRSIVETRMLNCHVTCSASLQEQGCGNASISNPPHHAHGGHGGSHSADEDMERRRLERERARVRAR